MEMEKLTFAFNAFVHVGGPLVHVIAVFSLFR